MEKIINQLSIKYKIDPEIIEKVIRSEFNFVKDTIERGELESVHLHHLGKFGVKPRFFKNKNFIELEDE